MIDLLTSPEAWAALVEAKGHGVVDGERRVRALWSLYGEGSDDLVDVLCFRSYDAADEAVAMLGMTHVRSLVMAAALGSSFKGVPGIDLKQFKLWYSQAGTPMVTVSTTYDAAEGTFTLASQDTSEIGSTDPKTLKQADITIASTDTLKDIITKINATTKDSGISATIIDGRLSLTAAQLGDRTISATSATDLADKLALNPAAAGATQASLATGTSAKVTVNNTITLERNSNTIADAIEGMTLNLKGTTAGSSVSVSVADDTDNTLKVVKDFVEQYNSTVSFITEKLSVGNPTSTTNVAGALSGDSTLMRLQSSLRQMLTGGVAIQKTNPTDPNETQKYDFIGSLGISVDRYGKASIDETKLKEVITKEPDRVAGFFSRSITVDGTTEKKKVGLAEKLQTVVNSFVDSKDGMITAKNKTYDKAMDDIAKKIEAFNVRMEAQRARYVKTFTALDTAMMQAESQMSYLSSQLTSSND